MGIDQSFTGCGVVILRDNGELIESAIFTTSKDLTVFDRSWILFLEIYKMAVKHKIEQIAIEGLAYSMKGNATRSLAILQGVLVTNLKNQKEIEGLINPVKYVEIISPSALKKNGSGNGKASKDQMINNVPSEIIEIWKEKFPKKQHNNLADAYHLAKTLISKQ